MKDETSSTIEKKDNRIVIKLIVGSIIGICFFMLPFNWKGQMTLPLIWARDIISAPIKPVLPIIIMILAIFSAIVSLIPKFKKDCNFGPYMKNLFVVSPVALVARILAAVVTIIAYFKIGPAQLWDENTGGLIVFFLMPSLLVLFLLGTIMLPFLTEYGAMEIIGIVLKPVFKPLFKIPGRYAVLAISSWVGSGTIGMITTNEEYKKGYLTGREAAIICFGFCTITLPNMFIYATSIGGLEVSIYSFYYLTLVIVCVVSTMIIARIPPVSLISNEYYHSAELEHLEEPSKNNQLIIAFDQAYNRAKTAPNVVKILKNGVVTSFRLYMDVFPLIILLATVVLTLIEFTPIFTIVATPLVPVLNLLGIPEASAVAPNLLTGFADLLLPFLGATNIHSQLAKFIVCAVGTMQVICMSETGAVMLKSDIPVKFKDLAFVFLEKTVITFIIALIMGRLIGLN